MTDIRILSCPQCGFPRIRDVGNGVYQCDDCGTHFDKHENIVQTKEEWFCGLSTEEKAEFLWNYTHDLLTDWEHVNDPMFRQMPLKNVLGDNCTKKEAWVKWLKEVHKE